MSNKTLIGMAKKEEVSRFMMALHRAKQDEDGARAYARLNPVCSKCHKGEHVCQLMPDGIRCIRCRTLKLGCPRVVDFWITHTARRLGRSEAYVKDLYYQHGTSKRSAGGARESRPSESSGSTNSKRAVESGRQTVVVIEEGSEEEEQEVTVDFESDEDEAISRDNQGETRVLPPQPSKIKAHGQSLKSGTNRREGGTTHSDAKSELESQRKENELLRRRAETAEGNFVALVGRVQDFRTSLRSEIRTMPREVESEGLSRLSAAMETTIDDAGLYLRDISGTLKQSRNNWEIQHGTLPAEVDKSKEGGSKEPRGTGSVRQVRQRSPDVSDEYVLKRRKI